MARHGELRHHRPCCTRASQALARTRPDLGQAMPFSLPSIILYSGQPQAWLCTDHQTVVPHWNTHTSRVPCARTPCQPEGRALLLTPRRRLDLVLNPPPLRNRLTAVPPRGRATPPPCPASPWLRRAARARTQRPRSCLASPPSCLGPPPVALAHVSRPAVAPRPWDAKEPRARTRRPPYLCGLPSPTSCATSPSTNRALMSPPSLMPGLRGRKPTRPLSPYLIALPLLALRLCSVRASYPAAVPLHLAEGRLEKT